MLMNKHLKVIWFWVTAYSVAMGYLESAVVVYLREIYYPEGFSFPLKMMNQHVAITEIFREAATIVMLAAIAVLSGKSVTEKLAWFIFAFAIWDITYYLFLYLLLGWPPSLFTWDILFLIPVTWVGPVIAPIINSLTMIALAIAIISYSRINAGPVVKPVEWIILIAGSLMVMYGYMEDYLSYATKYLSLKELLVSGMSERNVALMHAYEPGRFAWWWYAAGELLFVVSVLVIANRGRKRMRAVQTSDRKTGK